MKLRRTNGTAHAQWPQDTPATNANQTTAKLDTVVERSPSTHTQKQMVHSANKST